MQELRIDNMRVEFNLIIPENEDWSDSVFENKPIVKDGNAIGIITEAELDDSGLWYHCKGVIFERFVGVEAYKNNSTFDLCGVVIK